MTGEIRIAFDSTNGKVAVAAPMANNVQKHIVVKVLSAAIGIVLDYDDNKKILTPPPGNGIIPVPTGGGNGAPN